MYELKEDEEVIERTHIYVVPERAAPDRLPLLKKLLSLLCASFLFMALSSFNTSTQFISVSAHVLPVQTLSASVPIVPTGVNVIPATFARGTLTVYNGSILMQQLQRGFIVESSTGGEFVADETMVIPAGNPPAYGMARVPAHAVVAGRLGNIAPLAINAVYGSSLFVKNSTAFAGGADSYTEPMVTDADKRLARSIARSRLLAQTRQRLLDSHSETETEQNLTLSVLWSCQFVEYRVPPGVQVESAQRVGDHVVLQIRR